MARNQEQNEKIKEERLAKILTGALYLFAQRGYSATKISDIAQKTGMSQGLIYHYFQNKDQVFNHIIAASFEKLVTASHGLREMACSPHEKILSAIEHLLQGFESNEETALTYLLIAHSSVSDAIPEDARSVINENRLLPYGIIEEILEAGQGEQTIISGEPKILATLFWSMIKGIALHKTSHNFTIDEEVIKSVQKMFVKREFLC